MYANEKYLPLYMIQLNVFTYLTGSRSLILHDWGRRPRGGIAPPTTPHFPPIPLPHKICVVPN